MDFKSVYVVYNSYAEYPIRDFKYCTYCIKQKDTRSSKPVLAFCAAPTTDPPTRSDTVYDPS